jgi:hypothetical protein
MDLPDDLDKALSAFENAQNLPRDEAIKRILREWLVNEGYMASGEQGIPPYRLNASNDD